MKETLEDVCDEIGLGDSSTYVMVVRSDDSPDLLLMPSECLLDASKIGVRLVVRKLRNFAWPPADAAILRSFLYHQAAVDCFAGHYDIPIQDLTKMMVIHKNVVDKGNIALIGRV